MPRTSNTLFTGRDAILDSMNKALLAPRTTSSETLRRVFVLLGIGGSGKSEVAVKFAEMHRESFWGVFWVDADTPQSAESGFEKIAEACKPPDSSIDGVRDWLANTRKSWLLVLDNCDNSDIDYNRYLPPTERGMVIMTTRLPECKKHGITERIDQMEHQDGVKLLLKASHVLNTKWEQEQASAESVTRLLGFHALALVHAGSYINSGHCTLSQYPKIYEDQQRRLFEYKPRQMRSRYGSVYAIFEVSASALKAASSQDDTSALALQLLEVLAFMHRDNVQEIFFERASEWIPLQEAADLLEKIVDARKTLEASDEDRLVAQHSLATLYSRLGERQKAIPLLEEIIRIRKTTLEPEDSHLLGSQHALARAYSDTGEYQKAITLLEEVVRIRETTLKPEHPGRLSSQHELARAYSETGEYQKAITLLEEIVRIGETTLKPGHPERLKSQYNLALDYAEVCQYEKAKGILEKSTTTPLPIAAGSALKHLHAFNHTSQPTWLVRSLFEDML
ncbi:hypothetical protein M8818_003911 [Zalaria obscura]|uniref:Uncharacterized protein n=1 Tax=Zalaria obscura TaxID=2024903 RepID=A0ACC3SD06_9PEZI